MGYSWAPGRFRSGAPSEFGVSEAQGALSTPENLLVTEPRALDAVLKRKNNTQCSLVDASIEGRRINASKGYSSRPAGAPVDDDHASKAEDLEDGTRKANSNLQRLIEAVGGLLAASGDLLTRLQQILGGAQPAARRTNGSEEPGPPRPKDASDD